MLNHHSARLQYATDSAFQSLARDIFGNLGVDFASDEGNAAELRTITLGPCRLSSVEASSHAVDGGRVVRNSHDPDAIKLILQAGGRSRILQNDISIDIGPGNWVAYDPTRPYSVANLSPVRQLILQMPRHNFSAAVLEALTRPCVMDAAEQSLHRVLFTMMEEALQQADGFDEEGQNCVGETLFTLAKTLIMRTGPNALERSAVSLKILRSRVKAYVEANLSRSDLDIAELARKMGCSRRYLFRAFEQDETTPSEYLWGVRLDKARERLMSPQFRASSISEIAFSCGFSSSAHFSRAVRKRFDCSPSEIRHCSVS
ncbi:MAG: helix-turn-helix domain-containing protein [Pelagibacterium sp.]|uniref:helix-turn-helix domain-containing protein n=1 Tax=Pelagibacterium sp. TaxID=1967288 RepID=UPI0032EFAD93